MKKKLATGLARGRHMKACMGMIFILMIALGVCFNPDYANALQIRNLTFSVAPTSGIHGYNATATVSFNFFRQALWAPDWDTIRFHVELWEDEVAVDEFIGIFGGPGGFPARVDNGNQTENVIMNPFPFIPHNTGGMHTFLEGDTIEVYAYIRDIGGKTSFSNVSSNIVDVTCLPVPEPATMLLLGTGLAAARLRKKK